MPSLSPHELQVIGLLMRQCGQQALQMATEKFQVYEKGLNDYVTNVDRALDMQLTTGLNQLFWQDGVISEENDQSWQQFCFSQENSHESNRRLWFIDPIDGTDDFIHGKPHYSVMVGTLEAHMPTAGWVYAPAFDQLVYGGQEIGLFQLEGDSPPVPLIPTRPDLSNTCCPMLIGYKDQSRYGAAINQVIPEAQFDSMGSFGLKVLQVIRGHAGLYVYLNGRVKLWDTVGPLALAQAAGLVCCDLEGNPLKFTPDSIDAKTLAHQQSIVVGWPHYVEKLRSRLQEAVLIT
ncbi:MAG: inositol monophosphatase family protein [Timaviella obliquedivisa GSE-PSE-MK23-08B]|jgi:3'(2'), 5'-bisphosphate nucleotidase|nr:inositol monophosphatase family protein [Timaviella obliquedivisa GSE-PSE-MK23-08B]